MAAVEPFAALRTERRDARYRLRANLRRVTGLRRLARCGRPLEDLLVVRRINGVHYYSGIATCGSAWICPVCASKIRLRRAAEISRAILAALEQELTILLVTRTIPHRQSDSLATTLSLLAEGRRYVMNQPKVKEARRSAGYTGSVAAKEVTYGSNGWNPHSHDLEIYQNMSLASFAELSDVYYSYLYNFYARHGFDGLSTSYGVQVEQVEIGGPALANYLTKARAGVDIQLTAAQEVTRADLKRGRSGSLTPFEIAAQYFETGDTELLKLWLEYEQATFNKSSLRFTQGLRKRLLPDESFQTDPELATQEVNGEQAVVFAPSLYYQITRIPGLEGKVLTALDTGGFTALVELLTVYHLDEPGGYYQIEHEESEKE